MKKSREQKPASGKEARVGQRVAVRFDEGWFMGRIAALPAPGRVAVAYDDGEYEEMPYPDAQGDVKIVDKTENPAAAPGSSQGAAGGSSGLSASEAAAGGGKKMTKQMKIKMKREAEERARMGLPRDELRAQLGLAPAAGSGAYDNDSYEKENARLLAKQYKESPEVREMKQKQGREDRVSSRAEKAPPVPKQPKERKPPKPKVKALPPPEPELPEHFPDEGVSTPPVYPAWSAGSWSEGPDGDLYPGVGARGRVEYKETAAEEAARWEKEEFKKRKEREEEAEEEEGEKKEGDQKEEKAEEEKPDAATAEGKKEPQGGLHRFIEGTFMGHDASTGLWKFRRDDALEIILTEEQYEHAVEFYHRTKRLTGGVYKSAKLLSKWLKWFKPEIERRQDSEYPRFKWTNKELSNGPRWVPWAEWEACGVRLGDGWTTAEEPRLNGKQPGHADPYYKQPDQPSGEPGYKCRSRKEVCMVTGHTFSGIAPGGATGVNLQISGGAPEKMPNGAFPRKQPSGALLPGELISGSKSSLNWVEPGSKRNRKPVEAFSPTSHLSHDRVDADSIQEQEAGPSKKRKGKGGRAVVDDEDTQLAEDDEFLAQLATRRVGVPAAPPADDETESEEEMEHRCPHCTQGYASHRDMTSCKRSCAKAAKADELSSKKAKGKKASKKPEVKAAVAEITDGVIEFYSFVQKRQELWRNRRRGLPEEEWTSDEKLREGHFCNVYRELDRGTVYLQNAIRKHRSAQAGPNHKSKLGSTADLELVLWLVVVYRRVNLVETFQEWRAEASDLDLEGDFGPPHTKEWPLFEAFVKARFEKGDKPVFTNAHICSGGLQSYITGCESLQEDLKPMAKRLTEAAEGGGQSVDLEACFGVIKSLSGVGEFFAWQILCDLLEARALPPHLALDENSFCQLGPGARNGLAAIYGGRFETENVPTEEWLAQAKQLQSVQDLAFGSFRQFNGWEVSLKNVEHCLCEYQKYKKDGASGVKPYKSRVSLDVQDPCAKCDEPASEEAPMLRCDLCCMGHHLKCLPAAIRSRAEDVAEFVCRECSRRLMITATVKS